MESVRVFGGSSTVLSTSYDPVSSSWKTSQQSLFEDFQQSLEALPKSGMTVSGRLYLLNNAEHPTLDVGGSALPTPTVNTSKSNPSTPSAWNRKSSLNVEVVKMFLPTPSCHEVKQGPNLASQWNRWEKHKIGSMVGIQVCRQMNISKEEAIGQGFQLHPHFVEEMMGFPIGWTDLNHSETQSSHSAQNGSDNK